MKDLRIVRGNDFSLIVPVRRIVFDKDGCCCKDSAHQEPLNLSDCSCITAFLIDEDHHRLPVCHQIQESDDSHLVLKVENCLLCGWYGIEIRGVYNGLDIRSYERKVFKIVETNSKSCVCGCMCAGEMVYEVAPMCVLCGSSSEDGGGVSPSYGQIKVIDSVDDAYIDDSTDALSVRQGVLLRQEIDRIWAKINECCGKMASITLTRMADGLVSELGDDVVFTYEVTGGINRVVVDSGSIGHTHDATNRTITLHIPANTDSLDRKTFTLTVTGMATTMDGDEVQVAEAPPATVQQAGHTPVVTSWRVGNITFTYGSIPATGGIVSVDTLIIPIIRTYDIALRSGSNEDTLYYEHGKSGNTYTPSLRFSKVEKQGSEISFTVSDELEGELNVAERDNPEGATDTGVVRVAFSFNGVGSLPALQGYALADLTQMAADAHATGRYSNLEITKFEYPNNLLWNDGDWKSPTIQIKMSEVWNDNSLVPKTYTLAQFASIVGHFQFIFPSTLASTNPNTGAISFPNNESASNKTYEIELLVGHDGCPTNAPVRKKFTVTKLAKPGDTYGDITLTYTTKNQSHEFGLSNTITITNLSQTVNGTSVNYPLNDIKDLIAFDWDHTAYPWINGVTKSFVGGKILVYTSLQANESSAPRNFVVSISFTMNGKPYYKEITLTQQGMAYQVYYGYSSAVPTSFSNRGTSNNTNIGTGPFTVTTTEANQAHCHWIMIPQDSGYSLDRVTEINNLDITFAFVRDEEHTFTDGTTNYIMYYDTDDGYFANKSNFYLTRNI